MLQMSTSSCMPYQGQCFSLTMHNILPEVPSNGIHVPFHTIVMEPFYRTFTFGPMHQQVAGGSHIGLESHEKVAGAFIGQGEFLVMSMDQFVILTPHPELPQLRLGTVLFPRKETHTAQVGQKGRSYPIRPGSCIMAYNMETSQSLKSMTVFLGVGCGGQTFNDVYRSAQGALASSLMHFTGIWQTIAIPQDQDNKSSAKIDLTAFDPNPNEYEKLSAMQTLISRVHQEAAIPVVRAYPISEERAKLLEALNLKRKRVEQQSVAKT